MKCIMCDRKILSATSLKVWVENKDGNLIKIGYLSGVNTVGVCGGYVGRDNVCHEALDAGQNSLTDNQFSLLGATRHSSTRRWVWPEVVE